MKIGVDESGPMLILFAENGKDCSCQIDEGMLSERNEIDDIAYIDVWNQVCLDMFSSKLFRTKHFTTGNYAIFYLRSRSKLIANLQKSHFQFTASMANLEFERIDKLLASKYGEQLKAEL